MGCSDVIGRRIQIMDFKNAKELLKVCQEQDLSISAVMLQRELTEGEQDPEETDRKMESVFLRL